MVFTNPLAVVPFPHDEWSKPARSRADIGRSAKCAFLLQIC